MTRTRQPAARAIALVGGLLLLLRPAAGAAKPKLAVMTIVDGTRRLSSGLLDALTDALRGRLAQSGKYIVIDKGRQAAALKKLIRRAKRESYKQCFSSKCQIPLGQALAADTILRTKISRVGSTYLLNAELVDLAKEAVTNAAQAAIQVERGMSRDDRLLDAVAMAAARLIGGSPAAPPATVDPGAMPPPGDDLNAEDTARREEAARRLAARDQARRRTLLARQRHGDGSSRARRRKRLTYLLYGWSSIATGVIAAGAGVYYVTAKVAAERDNADKATSASGIDRAAKAAKSARNTGLTMVGLAALAGGVGVLLLRAAGKLTTPIKVGGLELDRIPSTGPAKGGWAMSYSGRF